MINSVSNEQNTALRNQIIEMVNASSKPVAQNQSAEVRIKEEITRAQKEDNKKQLEGELRDLSKKLNDEMKRIGTDISFSYNEDIPGLMVTVREDGGNKVIREIPSKEAVELMKRMREVIGVIFDKQG